MKAISKLLMVLAAMVLTISANAQSNTGLTPFAGSTHAYHVDKSSLSNTTLTWSVSGGEDADYTFVGDVKTGENVSIKWNTAKTYTLIVEEKRNDLGDALAGCPTTRNITVVVSGNTFDVYAELVTTATTLADGCATVDNPVIDENSNGLNSDDTFGTTQRIYKVKASNLAPKGTKTVGWNYTYTLTNLKTGLATAEGLTDVTIDVDGTPSASGDIITVAEGVDVSTITVEYTTNNNRQDSDLDLVLELSNINDALGTPDSEISDASNKATFVIRAVPATTGITTK